MSFVDVLSELFNGFEPFVAELATMFVRLHMDLHAAGRHQFRTVRAFLEIVVALEVNRKPVKLVKFLAFPASTGWVRRQNMLCNPAFKRDQVFSRAEQAAVIGLIAFESNEFQYNRNHFPGVERQGSMFISFVNHGRKI